MAHFRLRNIYSDPVNSEYSDSLSIKTNEETPGWGIVNLYTQWQGDGGLQIRASVENIFDKDYTQHTAGFNRVMPSDVAMGDRLPGRGINAYANIAYAW